MAGLQSRVDVLFMPRVKNLFTRLSFAASIRIVFYKRFVIKNGIMYIKKFKVYIMRTIRIILLSILIVITGCAELIEPDDSPDSNDTPATAVLIESEMASISGMIETISDVDYYKISVPANKQIAVSLSVPASRNYDLDLRDSRDSLLAQSTKTFGQTEFIEFLIRVTQTYYIKVYGAGQSYSPKESYLLTVSVADSAAGSASIHMILGNPSGAAQNTDMPNNYLMEKPQYVLSYNNQKGTCNWVSWQVNASWLGSVNRQDDFRYDPDIPAGWNVVYHYDYSGSGYDRGHMCPSGDRTLTIADNSATFLMTNMIPQAPDNNQGPWAELENYTRSLASQGKDLFVISGGFGARGTIAGGKVTVPDRTWKIVVVLDAPGLGINGVTAATRVIAVDMPNEQGIRYHDWKMYRVSVDDLEAMTGYDFLSRVSPSIQNVIEARVDDQ